MKLALVLLALLVSPAAAKPMPTYDVRHSVDMRGFTDGAWPSPPRAKRAKIKRKVVSRAGRHSSSRSIGQGNRTHVRRLVSPPTSDSKSAARQQITSTIPLPSPRPLPDLARELGIYHIEPITESLGEVVAVPIKVIISRRTSQVRSKR